MACDDDNRIRTLERTSDFHSVRIQTVETLITDHVKECRETRREMRTWLLSILGTILAAMVVAWFKFS